MKKYLILVFLFSLAAFSQAQYVDEEEEEEEKKSEQNDEESFFDRMVLGGTFQLSFGTSTVVGISPIVGYKVTDRFTAGIGGTYTYVKIDYRQYGVYENSIYGGSVFGRYYVFDDVFAHSEFTLINLKVPGINDLVRKNVEMLYVGGGYRMRLGDRAFVSLMVLFDVFDSPDSPYQNPAIRGGLQFGL